MSAIRSDVEENGTQDAKVSDSGYSNSCRNSQSQRSTGSSKSRHSNSSASSGYCGRPTALGNVCEDSGSSESQAGGGKRKEKSDTAKVKSKGSSTSTSETSPSIEKDQERVEPIQVENPDPSQPQQSNSSQQIDPTINLRSPSNNCEALQIAALTQTLTCIKKHKHKDRTDDDTRNQSRMRIDDRSQDIINNCIKHVCTDEEEMQMVVSMQDGVVLYSSPNLIDVLGYPKDMWVGRSLIDFVHPRHRIAFANHITSIIVSSQSNLSGNNNGKHANFYCCLRQYRGLVTTGFNIMDKRVSYLPCQMSVSFREFQISGQASPIIFLVIATSLVRSAYKYPDERKISPKFTIRHCSSALMSHVDPEVVQYLGYLPQDLVGQSVLDYYHPEDLPIIKSTYNSVIMEEKQPVRSKPYRFRCQNGGFVVMDTEWSAFVNPWSRKLEFMIGQHVVLKGPPFPDVTTPVENEPIPLSEELVKESKKLEEEIKIMLSNTVGCNTETAKKQASKRCKDLATFMETFMDEINKTPDTKDDIHMKDDKSFSERDSVMLGEISPHHEYFDSKSSSKTPPSYNQLNYKENLQRFFESKPMTTVSGGSTGNKTETATSNSPPPHNNSECSRGESSGEGQSFSCSSGNVTQPLTALATPKVAEAPQAHAHKSSKYNAPHLTEQILWKHNEDMEKQMVKKHREQRSRSSENKSKDKHKSLFDKQQEEMGSHGLKRSGSHSFEGEPFKAIKSTHESQNKSNCQVSPLAPPVPVVQPTTSNSSVNLWSPFAVDTFNNNRQNMNGAPLTSPLMPIYFLPSPSVPQPEQRPDAPSRVFNQFLLPQGNNGISPPCNNNNYVAGMVYQPLLVSATPGPVLYSPLTVLPAPVFPTHPPMKPPPPQTPPSQPQNLSEPCKSTTAPRVTTDEESFGTSNVYDDSSFYSSFGSFALHKTDKSDESMKSSSENEKREMSWERPGKHGGGFKNKPVKRVAPWMQEVTLTTELTLKYQLKDRKLDEVLKADIEALEKFNQPSLVNDQLCQMYLDLEIEGLSKTLTLEEGITSSSSDSCTDDPQSSSSKDKKKKKRFLEFEKMAILYEENAPLPPPLVEPLPT